jgi:hypothetical protein
LRLAIPHAPRVVPLTRVPGALRRLFTAAAAGLVVAGGLGLGARALSSRGVREHAFLSRAQVVPGQINEVRLPPADRREGGTATLDVIYVFDDRHLSASGVLAAAEDAEGWGHGKQVDLLVDPADPDHPREAGYARGKGRQWNLLPYGLGAGFLLAAALFAWQARRLFRAEVQPLRKGALVWLTPDAPLPDTPKETVFRASYFREDVRHEVRARGRPGRAPVRNGEKVLAAVVPKEPTWVRVIDEDLARGLGWMVE